MEDERGSKGSLLKRIFEKIFQPQKQSAGLKLMRDELSEKEKCLKAVYDNTTDGVLLANQSTNQIRTANKMMIKMLGYSEEEIKGLVIRDICLTDDISQLTHQFKKQSGGEIKVAVNIPIKRKDDSIFYADIHTVPVILKGENYWLTIFRDVTERKHIQERQAILQEKLFQIQKLKNPDMLAEEIAQDFDNIVQGLTKLLLTTEYSSDNETKNL